MTTTQLLPHPRIEARIAYHLDGDYRPMLGYTQYGYGGFEERGDPPANAAGWVTNETLTAAPTYETIADLLGDLVRKELWPLLQKQLNEAKANPDLDLDEGGETTFEAILFDRNGNIQAGAEGETYGLCDLRTLLTCFDDMAQELAMDIHR